MKPILSIMGPTATGKTQLAVKLALDLDGEIVSADSRQLYRGMDIGTGKDLKEYEIEGKKIPYHLIDIAEAGTEYNVFLYQQAATLIIKDIQKRSKKVILCGGSGLYIEALLKSYRLYPVPENPALRNIWKHCSDEELEASLASLKSLHNKTDIETRERLERALEIEYYYQEYSELKKLTEKIPSLTFCLYGNRDLIRQKITHRLKERLQHGMIEEVEYLIANGVEPRQLIRYGLEYKYITQYILGELDYETMFDRLNIAIHQFSKRQMTWFRKMERDGVKFHWIDISLGQEKMLKSIKNELKTPPLFV
jgi:tRNA dimethylallyltransferase